MHPKYRPIRIGDKIIRDDLLQYEYFQRKLYYLLGKVLMFSLF